VHSALKKGQCGNPRRLRRKNLTSPLVDALDEKMVATHVPMRRQGTL
jgi:hypothetical protein